MKESAQNVGRYSAGNVAVIQMSMKVENMSRILWTARNVGMIIILKINYKMPGESQASNSLTLGV